jgi:hypothetical protein
MSPNGSLELPQYDSQALLADIGSRQNAYRQQSKNSNRLHNIVLSNHFSQDRVRHAIIGDDMANKCMSPRQFGCNLQKL